MLAACAPAAANTQPTAVPPTAIATAGVAPSTTPVATTRVTIENFAFSPAAIVVPVGSTVTWTNQDLEEHTVTAHDNTFASDVVGNGRSFSYTFTRPGTYNYFCSIHTNMVGKVVVAR